jgi:hypothetical protein
LLMVPAILAMQQDFGKQIRALRRGVGAFGRAPALTMGIVGIVALLTASFALTLGSTLVTGAMPAVLASRVPAGLQGVQGSFALFVIAAAVLCCLAWVVGGLLVARSYKRAPQG